MTARCILTIEDDAAIRRGIVDALEVAGYRVLQAARAAEGRAAALEQPYDLLLLDLVLPGGSGLDILRAVREQRPATPVIILTARGDENDRVAGLKLGADDYVVKPFSVRELLARVEAVMRRAPHDAHTRSPLELARVGTVDFGRCEIQYPDGTRADLSQRELQLLDYLAAHPERAVSREELLSKVWGIDARGVTTRTIDMHVARLREKLRDDAADPRVLRTVRGKGYLLSVLAEGVEQEG
jgi:DNA-binding response OmpR family regulator